MTTKTIEVPDGYVAQNDRDEQWETTLDNGVSVILARREDYMVKDHDRFRWVAFAFRGTVSLGNFEGDTARGVHDELIKCLAYYEGSTQ